MINAEQLDLLCRSAMVIGRLQIVTNHSTKSDDLAVLAELHGRFKETLLREHHTCEYTPTVVEESAASIRILDMDKVRENLRSLKDEFEPEDNTGETWTECESGSQVDPADTKTCSGCGITKPVSEFAMCNSKPRTKCIICWRAYCREQDHKRRAKKTAATSQASVTSSAQNQDDIVYVDQNNARFYIDELTGDGETRYTLWKHKSPSDPMCLASLLDEYSTDGTFPTRELAQSALDKFAQTQRQWRRCRRKTEVTV